MKFFVDTADIKEINELAEMGIVDGVTTNPSLIYKSGRDFKEVIKEISESKNLIAVLPIENDWWLNSLPMNIYIFGCLPVFENNCLGFLLGQVKPERARNNKSILVCNEESKNWISQKYNFTIISNLQDKFMISVNEYYEDIEIKDVSILGSFGYIKTG